LFKASGSAPTITSPTFSIGNGGTGGAGGIMGVKWGQTPSGTRAPDGGGGLSGETN
jgi:hypothetical protein